MAKIVALVPMRHHSQRVLGKNYRNMLGKPLFHYIIQTLLECTELSQVVVDTDSEPVMQGLGENFPSVLVLSRPEYLRSDIIPMNEILTYDTSQIEADFYLQTHATNPLLLSNTIQQAIRTFLANYPSYDSLFSVTRVQTRLWDQLGRALNHNPAILLQTQDLPPVFEENSCMYIFSRETLMARRNRIGERSMMYEIDASEAMDIDDEFGFAVTELMMLRKSNK